MQTSACCRVSVQLVSACIGPARVVIHRYVQCRSSFPRARWAARRAAWPEARAVKLRCESADCRCSCACRDAASRLGPSARGHVDLGPRCRDVLVHRLLITSCSPRLQRFKIHFPRCWSLACYVNGRFRSAYSFCWQLRAGLQAEPAAGRTRVAGAPRAHHRLNDTPGSLYT
jgi:hypothetical protein